MRAWMSLEAYKEAIVTADHTKNLMDVTMINKRLQQCAVNCNYRSQSGRNTTMFPGYWWVLWETQVWCCIPFQERDSWPSRKGPCRKGFSVFPRGKNQYWCPSIPLVEKYRPSQPPKCLQSRRGSLCDADIPLHSALWFCFYLAKAIPFFYTLCR